MDVIIKAKRRDTGKLVYLSDPNDSVAQTEAKFMPFRLARVHSEYEWAELIEGANARRERFDLPPDSSKAAAEKAAAEKAAAEKAAAEKAAAANDDSKVKPIAKINSKPK